MQSETLARQGKVPNVQYEASRNSVFAEKENAMKYKGDGGGGETTYSRFYVVAFFVRSRCMCDACILGLFCCFESLRRPNVTPELCSDFVALTQMTQEHIC